MSHCQPSRPLTRFAAALALSITFAGGNAPSAMALELIVFDADWCAPCRKFKKEVLPEYKRSELGAQIPMRLEEMRDQAKLGIELAEKVVEVPMFVLVSDGVEVARFAGYSTAPKFWAELRENAEPHME